MKFAICYWGVPRTLGAVLPSHQHYVYNVLRDAGIEWDVYAHFWLTNTNKVWETTMSQPIDYAAISALQPTKYCLELQQPFVDTLGDLSQYYYAHEADREWLPDLIRNHLCALESQKRCVNLVLSANTHYDYVLFLRPDALVESPLPIHEIVGAFVNAPNTIVLPSNNHYEGLNDRFAVLPLYSVLWYSHRVNGIAEFRKAHGRIVSEKYVKHIVEQHYSPKMVEFYFRLLRSDGSIM
jgi:hypothetical protein